METARLTLTAEDVRDAVVTIQRGESVTELRFDAEGEPIDDAPDETVTRWLPTDQRTDGLVPIERHRNAWDAVLGALGASGRMTKTEQTMQDAIEQALTASNAEWVTVLADRAWAVLAATIEPRP